MQFMDFLPVLDDVVKALVAFVVASLLPKASQVVFAFLRQQLQQIHIEAARQVAISLVRACMQSMTKEERVAGAKAYVQAFLRKRFPYLDDNLLDPLIEEVVYLVKREAASLPQPSAPQPPSDQSGASTPSP